MKNAKVLFSWIGQTDLNAVDNQGGSGLGPLAETVEARSFDRLVLLSNYPKAETNRYVAWLKGRCGLTPEAHLAKLSSPMNYGEIFEVVVDRMARTIKAVGQSAQLYCLLSPGTSAMASIWIIAAKTRYGAVLLQSSREQGVEEVQIPFDLAAEFLPDLYRGPDHALTRLSSGEKDEPPEFKDIIHQSAAMQLVIHRAHQCSMRNVPVLIEGESGTGKELFARAIHAASPRAAKPLVAVNCGAIAPDLIESELFGHSKGAFTGATNNRKGHFEEADGGTLFLDELGELLLSAQVKLLRVLQEGAVMRLGGSKEVKVDVRIVAATNRSLAGEVRDGRFRADLFYRLAVAVLNLPPLRERQGDISLLIDAILEQINRESASDPNWIKKKLSVSGRNVLLNHRWPGNVRELQNTLLRASVWADEAELGEATVRESLLPMSVEGDAGDGILGRSIEGGVDLPEILSEVSRHYLQRVWQASGGNLRKCAELTGLKTYQTFKDWARKHDVSLD